MKFTGINSEGKTVEIPQEKVKIFGTRVISKRNKDGSFKKFDVIPFVSDKQETIQLNSEKWKITDLKKVFPEFTATKQYHTRDKKGKTKKAIEWKCTVEKEGEIILHESEFDTLKTCNERKRLFTIKGEDYFFVLPNIYRNNVNNIYYYLDETNKKLISLNYTSLDSPTKKDLTDEIYNYRSGLC